MAFASHVQISGRVVDGKLELDNVSIGGTEHKVDHPDSQALLVLLAPIAAKAKVVEAPKAEAPAAEVVEAPAVTAAPAPKAKK